MQTKYINYEIKDILDYLAESSQTVKNRAIVENDENIYCILYNEFGRIIDNSMVMLHGLIEKIEN
jgi:hypothetical protein